LIFKAEYYFLLNSCKGFKDSCRGYYDCSDNFYKVYYNIGYVDIFVNRIEICIFIKGKNFARRINYKDDSKDICVNQNIKDCWINNCYYERMSFWKAYIINLNINCFFRLKDDSLS